MLSGWQQRCLNRAVFDYIQEEGGSDTLLKELRELFGNEGDNGIAEVEQDRSILKQKWISIVRLQSKIVELEKRNEKLCDEIARAPVKEIVDDGLEWVPREKCTFRLVLESSVTAMCLHPILPVIYIGLENGKLLRYDILSHEMPLQSVQAHVDAVTTVSISRGERGLYLASGSKDAICKIWEVEADSSLVHVRTLRGHENTISGSQFFERGTDVLLATCSRDLQVKIWDISTGYCSKSFQAHTQWVRTVKVHGEFVVTGSNDSSLRLSHWPSGNGLSMGIGHEYPVEEVCILFPVPGCPDSAILPQYSQLGFQYVASASRDGSIRIWKVCLPKFVPHRDPRPNPLDTNFKVVAILKDHKSWVRDIRQFGSYLFSCSDDGTIKCWKIDWLSLSKTECIKQWDLNETGFQNCLTMDDYYPGRQSLRRLLFSGSTNGTLTCYMR